MTHQEYIVKWNGKYQERRDSTNLNQCFDLAVGYVIDVFGLPETTFQGLLYAYQIFDKPTDLTSKNFDFIKNTPYAVPKTGDIIVWGKTYNGTAGHVAVVNKGNTDTFEAFSQNDPTGAKCILKTYPYTHVSGWLRKVGNTASGDLEACLTAHKKAVDDYNTLKETKETMISNLQGELASANAHLKTEQDANLEKKETIKHLEEDVREYNLSLSTMQAERDEALAQKTKAENEAQGMVAEVEGLRQLVLDLKEELASKPIPYKKLYEEAKLEVEKLTEKMDKDMIPYAKIKVLKALQQVAYDLDIRLKNI